MDAPLTQTDAIVRPWRLATLVASLVAAVELVGLVVLGFLLLAKPLSHALQQRATAAPAPAKATRVVRHLVKPAPIGKPKHTRAQTGVLVLNGNGRAGAAHSEAARLQRLGYRIRGAANAQRSDYATTVVMFRPRWAAEGHRLARDLHVAVVGPLDGMRTSKLDGAQLVVLLGAR
ncbi:MAG TPA: LytR C-terminal domain-containing protein [Gaiellaceae bacterium]|nr:LytR C-terminal domain-containing protein [Gaiellaceae bacterium]